MKTLRITLVVMTMAFLACLMILRTGNAASTPTFSLAWSEYPSWSVFGVAHVYGLIDGRKGKLGPIEEKWGVDIELKEADYDSCIVMYGAGQCDGVCITNMDVLNPSLSIKSIAIMPTSTSYGADALIVSNKIASINQLKGVPVYGLAKSVSEYTFVRNIEMLGLQEKDFKFVNMDPGAAALAMQQKQSGYDAIVVWNPFVLETLNKRPDVHVLFDSTKIPGEIIDMVVISEASLNRPGGKNFAMATLDAYYQVAARMADPKTRNDTLIALGEKFSHLDLKSMEIVVKQTQFYSTPAKGLELFTGNGLRNTMAQRVVPFCVSHEIVPSAPTVGYGATAQNVNLRFDPSFMQNYK